MEYTFQADHFPIMPVMQKAARPSADTPSSCSIPPPTQALPGIRPDDHTSQTRLELDATHPMIVDETSPQPTPLHACPHCQTRFLIATGLEKPVSTHGHELQADGQLVRAAKIPKFDTVPIMLNKPFQHIEAPSKSFQCPHCLETVGRKALAGHLSREHKVEKQPFFIFRRSRDMTPGRLACAHCHTTYTIEAALRLHYQRASCPTLLIEWVRDQHFGPTVPPSAQSEAHMPDDPVHADRTHSPTSGRTVMIIHELCMPADTPEYPTDMTWPLLTPASMSVEIAWLICIHSRTLILRSFRIFASWIFARWYFHVTGLGTQWNRTCYSTLKLSFIRQLGFSTFTFNNCCLN